MHSTIKSILEYGKINCPTKGSNRELTGVLIELTHPRNRISRTETRGKPFSCLGEFCWYLAGTNSVKFITHYLSDYRHYAEAGKIFGGYGPRIFRLNGVNQIANVTRLLKKNPQSRRAVIQLFDADDLQENHQDIPCTCSLQLMVRRGRLQMMTHMRSNDVFLGLPHDVFAFTMLQEIMARVLSVDLGTYKHSVGSLHLYDKNLQTAREFLGEGFQPTNLPMPKMPVGDPCPALKELSRAECLIRHGNQLDSDLLDRLDPYWADLIRLLQVYACKKNGDLDCIKAVRKSMDSPIYDTFIRQTMLVF